MALSIALVVLFLNYCSATVRFHHYGYDYNSMYPLNESLVSAYNPESQLCCSGHVFSSAANSYQQCCGSQEFDVTRQICCDGTVHSLKIGYHCCGGEYFSVKQGICCTNPTTGSPALIMFPANVSGNAEAIQSSKCCGSRVFDVRTHICCSEMRRYPTFYRPWLRNGGDSTRVISLPRPRRYGFSASRRWQFTVYEKKYAQTGCCKGKIYNKKTATCPAPIVPHTPRPYNRHYGTSRPNHYRRQQFLPGRYAMYSICNHTRFNFRTHICCTLIHQTVKSGHHSIKVETQLVEIKSERTSCCGLKAYDYEKEICCDNSQIHTQNPEGSLECCGTSVYDTTKQRCCETSRAIESVDKLPDTADSCCGSAKTPYDSNTQICCGNSVFELPKSVESHSHYGYHSRHRVYCCWSNSSGHEPSIFDPATESCCGGAKFSNNHHRHSCCGSQTFDWQTELCCNGNKTKRASRHQLCCGGNTYDMHKELCCDYNSGTVLKRTSNDEVCCGTEKYNRKEQICCRNYGVTNTFPRTFPHMQCCNNTAINTDTHQCCDRTVVDKSKLCCSFLDDGVYVSTSVDKVSPNAECCGRDSYNPDKQKCCNNTVVEAGTGNERCCGSTVYDPKTQTCCGTKVYDDNRSKHGRCCGNHIYDSEKHICCSGVVKRKDDPAAEYSCCYADDVFHYKK